MLALVLFVAALVALIAVLGSSSRNGAATPVPMSLGTAWTLQSHQVVEPLADWALCVPCRTRVSFGVLSPSPFCSCLHALNG